MSQGCGDTCPPQIYLDTVIIFKVPPRVWFVGNLQGDPMMYEENQGAKIIMKKKQKSGRYGESSGAINKDRELSRTCSNTRKINRLVEHDGKLRGKPTHYKDLWLSKTEVLMKSSGDCGFESKWYWSLVVI